MLWGVGTGGSKEGNKLRTVVTNNKIRNLIYLMFLDAGQFSRKSRFCLYLGARLRNKTRTENHPLSSKWAHVSLSVTVATAQSPRRRGVRGPAWGGTHTPATPRLPPTLTPQQQCHLPAWATSLGKHFNSVTPCRMVRTFKRDVLSPECNQKRMALIQLTQAWKGPAAPKKSGCGGETRAKKLAEPGGWPRKVPGWHLLAHGSRN